MPQFTKTETKRRLRKLTAAARVRDRRVVGMRVEVGYRTDPVALLTEPTHSGECYGEHDDLADYDTIDAASADDQVREHGAIVHLYFSETFADGELYDVQIGWMGTPDADPVYLPR